MKKKHLGQHFLHDPKLLQKIAEASPARAGDLVLEIGPGDGALTRAILDKGCKVIAVEYDTDLIPELSERFISEIASSQLRIVQGDFLEISLVELLKGGHYHVIANIPYYITGAILRKLLSGDCQPLSAALIMQREVAERIVCRDDKQSLLSLSVAAYGAPYPAFRIAAGAFNPPPNVDSALLVVSNISRKLFKEISTTPSPLSLQDSSQMVRAGALALLPQTGFSSTGEGVDLDALVKEKFFFELIHAGFTQRRKQLYKLIAHILPREVFDVWCKTNNFPSDIRAEDVTLPAWIQLVALSCA